MAGKEKSSNFQKYFILFVLCMGAGLIYNVAYLRQVFYEPLRAALDITNEQVGALSTTYGTIAMFCYLPGGIIADKINGKILLIFSFISTGLLTFWYATIPSYGTIKLILALMAITTILTFWSAFLKGVRALGTDKEQGRMFGLSEGIRTIFTIIGSFVTLAIMGKAATDKAGLRGVLIFYGIVYIAVGVFAIFFMPNTKKESSGDEFKIKDIGKVLKSPGVWLVAAAVFGIYNVYVLSSYTTPYIENVCLVPAVMVGIIGIIRQYGTGLLASPVVGFIGDKVGSPTKTLGACALVSGVSVVLLMVIPSNAAVLIPVILTVMIGFMSNAMRGVQYATMPEAKIPLLITGTATGLISTIGYLPDVYVYTQVGRWLDNYPPEKAYRMIFLYMTFMAILVFLSCVGIYILYKRKANIQETA